MKNTLILRVILFVAACPLLSGQSLEIFTDLQALQVGLVANELETVLSQKIGTSSLDKLSEQDTPIALAIILAGNSAQIASSRIKKLNNIEKEGFAIRKTAKGGKTTVWLVAADPAGLLYGGYELAEQIRCYGINGIRETDQNPYMAMRGVKFNIPLDVRTPSYTHPCDAAQNNIAEMWDFAFWKQFIDSLARNRYNYISCWSLHPFPSLVKVPGFEEVALDDLQRSTIRWEEHYPLEGKGFDAPEILDNVEILKEMTIDEKITFWRKVMAYAKLHNIDFYFVTWNIFTNGTFGKYGITDKADDPVTRDYFRKSVKAMFTTYPDLKGIGLTTGENMHDSTFEEKEDWAYETYAKGVLDVVKEQPGRKITFIHRQHMAGALEIADKFKPVIDHPDVEFIYSFKYAKAHVYSSTKQPYHRGFVKDIQGRGDLKTIWTLRNDDVYHFRWGAPDFVREFMQNIPYDVSRGYYYGSDQYIWGREFLAREPESPRQIEIDKHWYQWMLWGRLGYDPDMTNDRFISILQSRYSGINVAKLFEAWQEASMIYPATTGYHWGPLDFIWYIEACQGRTVSSDTPTGFHDINRFITMGPHPGTDNISIPDYVKALASGEDLQGSTPLQAAGKLHAHADRALELVQSMRYTGNKELRLALDDIRTMAWLGKYYAHKIEAAAQLALFRNTLDPRQNELCIDNLNTAAMYWRSYASLALSNNHNPLWTNRVGHVDWRKTFQSAVYDVRSVGGKVSMPSMQASMGGSILEAELANFGDQAVRSDLQGFTGNGYVEMNRNNKMHDIVWTYDAPAAGRYVLELRYSNPWNRSIDSPVLINDQKAGILTLWETGKGDNWVWDRIVIDLQSGSNKIRIKGGGRYFIDHLNVIPTGEANLR